MAREDKKELMVFFLQLTLMTNLTLPSIFPILTKVSHLVLELGEGHTTYNYLQDGGFEITMQQCHITGKQYYKV